MTGENDGMNMFGPNKAMNKNKTVRFIRDMTKWSDRR